MVQEQLRAGWAGVAAELEQDLASWRETHPTATLAEIEAAVLEALSRLQERYLTDLVHASAATQAHGPAMELPCRACGGAVEPRGGAKERTVLTLRQAAPLRLRRRSGVCTACGVGLFPLDEELALLPGELSPTVEQGLARLCAVLPFAAAAEHLAFFWGVPVSPSTARRHAEGVGAADVSLQDEAVAELERTCPAPPAGPPVQQVSADGAMVPLVGGKWAEVRTVAVATVGTDERTGRVEATEPSYFSRLTDHETFIRLAHVELHRRGTETAGRVAGVMDGAVWLQVLLDRYRPDAVRVLDFPHGLEHLAAVARLIFGTGTAAGAAWLAEQADALKHGATSAVLVALSLLPLDQAANPAATGAERDRTFRYLEQRLEQIQSAEFVALGYPIGSGLVESANKLVVEVRLKGSGMHWRRENVNPMLGLRNLTCNGRWSEAWPEICRQLRTQETQARAARHQVRQLRRLAAAPTPEQPASPPPLPPTPTPTPREEAKPVPRVVNGRPTAAHPWRRAFLRGDREKAAS